MRKVFLCDMNNKYIQKLLKIKEEYFQQAVAEYVKRAGRYAEGKRRTAEGNATGGAEAGRR